MPSPESMEKEVTSIIEGALNSIQGVRSISSDSKYGSGSVRVVLDAQVNKEAMRFEVANLIRNIYPSLPEGVSYPRIGISGQSVNERPVLSYAFLSPGGLQDLEEILEYQIKDRLEGLEGVDRVVYYGIVPMQWHLTYDLGKMDQLNISENDLRSAIRSTRLRMSVGFIEMDHVKKGVILTSVQNDSINWSAIPLKKVNGKIIYLTEVAQVIREKKAARRLLSN